MPGKMMPPKVNIIAPYAPLPWQVAPWKDKSRVLLCTGSAGGGKSRFAAEKLHAFCLRYPGSFALLVRKTLVSLRKGSILFLEDTVIGEDPSVLHHKTDGYFRYKNGSYLAYIGLEDAKQRERLKSIGQRGGVNIVWGEEANELEEADHNALLARLRSTTSPWRQVIYTCNPDSPLHWIKLRLIDNQEASVYYSGASDNPHNSGDYLDTLNSLTGIDDLRMNKGLWVKAEGVVFDTWADGGPLSSVSEDADYEEGAGQVYWLMDDGYSAGSGRANYGIDPKTGTYVHDAHPRVFLLAQGRPDGSLHVFAEHYACLTLSDDHISDVRAMGYPDPSYVIHGPGSAEIKGRLYHAGLMPVQGSPRVAESIKELRRALKPDANGWAAVKVHPRCRHLRREMATYAYPPGDEETPIKAYDHGPDALRVGYWVVRGQL